MNRLKCVLFAATLMISSSMLALGGEMQMPGKSEPTPTPSAVATASAGADLTQPTSTEETQIVWQNATTILVDLLLTIF